MQRASRSALQLRNPQLRETGISVTGHKQTCTEFSPKEDVMFIKLDRK